MWIGSSPASIKNLFAMVPGLQFCNSERLVDALILENTRIAVVELQNCRPATNSDLGYLVSISTICSDDTRPRTLHSFCC